MVLLSWENRRRSTGADRRRQRAMMRGYCRPWTGRMALVVAVLMACVALWVIAPPAMADALYTVTVDDYVYVREQPTKASSELGTINGGEQVTGTGYQDGWVQVSVSMELTEGWIRADLLTLADYPTGRYTNNTGGRVNIRQEPDGDHSAWLKAGHSVDVIRWVDVDGTAWAYTAKGYIKSDCLEVE